MFMTCLDRVVQCSIGCQSNLCCVYVCSYYGGELNVKSLLRKILLRRLKSVSLETTKFSMEVASIAVDSRLY